MSVGGRACGMTRRKFYVVFGIFFSGMQMKGMVFQRGFCLVIDYNATIGVALDIAHHFYTFHIEFLKRPIKSATLKYNPFYQLTSNFTFADVLRSK